METVELTVSEFIASINQTFEFAYPIIAVTGEVTNFKISKGSWVYFDLKDETASMRCFCSIYQLSFPVEDGMLIKAIGRPKLHNIYGFSFNIQSISPVGEGTIKKASELLEKKLTKDGLFDVSRKRSIAYPPASIGLVTSGESAAYADFTKIINARWVGLDIRLINVLVQGDKAPDEICRAIQMFNESADPPEVIVLTRGGGSAEDLYAFSTEQVTRAVAGSRIPTMVAIGHEIDSSLAEKAADKRASTPSNAAELLVPDKKQVLENLVSSSKLLLRVTQNIFTSKQQDILSWQKEMTQQINNKIDNLKNSLESKVSLLKALSPTDVLKRGYSIIKQDGKLIRSAEAIVTDRELEIQFYDSSLTGRLENIIRKVKK